MTGSMTTVREIWAERSTARSRGDVLYLVYVLAISIPVVVVPALRAAGTALARPNVLPSLLSGAAPVVATAALPALAAVMVMVGAVRGPALLAPFFTTSLAAGGLPRHRVLIRPLARAMLVPVLASLTAAGLIASTLLTAGHADGGAVAWFAVASAGLGLLLGAAWLLGQVLQAPARRVAVVLLGLAAAGAVLLPPPVLLGATYPSAPASAAPVRALGMLIAGIAAAAGCVPLLDRLRGRVLLEQATRWESATTIATTGDLAGAAGSYRARPTTGRRLGAIGGGPLPLVYARRDAIAWLRTPERSTIGLVAVLLGGATSTGGALATGPLAWFAICAGILILWAGSGPFVDGIRHAVETLGAPPLLAQSAQQQAVLHAIAPTVLLALAAGAGAGALVVLGPDIGPAPVPVAAAVALPVLLVPVLVVARVRDAAKGPMPLQLSTPMPTPQGDLSVIPILVWQSDAILLALAAGVVLALAAGTGTAELMAAAAVLIVVTAAMTQGRLRGLRA